MGSHEEQGKNTGAEDKGDKNDKNVGLKFPERDGTEEVHSPFHNGSHRDDDGDSGLRTTPETRTILEDDVPSEPEDDAGETIPVTQAGVAQAVEDVLVEADDNFRTIPALISPAAADFLRSNNSPISDGRGNRKKEQTLLDEYFGRELDLLPEGLDLRTLENFLGIVPWEKLENNIHDPRVLKICANFFRYSGEATLYSELRDTIRGGDLFVPNILRKGVPVELCVSVAPPSRSHFEAAPTMLLALLEYIHRYNLNALLGNIQGKNGNGVQLITPIIFAPQVWTSSTDVEIFRLIIKLFEQGHQVESVLLSYPSGLAADPARLIDLVSMNYPNVYIAEGGNMHTRFDGWWSERRGKSHAICQGDGREFILKLILEIRRNKNKRIQGSEEATLPIRVNHGLMNGATIPRGSKIKVETGADPMLLPMSNGQGWKEKFTDDFASLLLTVPPSMGGHFEVLGGKIRVLQLFLNRGCYGKCSFCVVQRGTILMYQSAESIEEAIKFFITNCEEEDLKDVQLMVWVEDSSFGVPADFVVPRLRQHIQTVTDTIGKFSGLKFGYQSRIQDVVGEGTEREREMGAEALIYQIEKGLRYIAVSPECMNEEALKEVGKNMTVSQVESFFQMLLSIADREVSVDGEKKKIKDLLEVGFSLICGIPKFSEIIKLVKEGKNLTDIKEIYAKSPEIITLMKEGKSFTEAQEFLRNNEDIRLLLIQGKPLAEARKILEEDYLDQTEQGKDLRERLKQGWSLSRIRTEMMQKGFLSAPDPQLQEKPFEELKKANSLFVDSPDDLAKFVDWCIKLRNAGYKYMVAPNFLMPLMRKEDEIMDSSKIDRDVPISNFELYVQLVGLRYALEGRLDNGDWTKEFESGPAPSWMTALLDDRERDEFATACLTQVREVMPTGGFAVKMIGPADDNPERVKCNVWMKKTGIVCTMDLDISRRD